ncbi:DUF4238 domain-containing protein [Sinorhizobium medicae]|nr:DUF4238 domain-containing protein [Sinorhizobium medicae]MDX0575887.1 DUF4238 domain-containing protein [Sinorhizobium medicae]MDX0779571.1 DUF4238 domain-containing protein [Sinorhizobium medicae]
MLQSQKDLRLNHIGLCGILRWMMARGKEKKKQHFVPSSYLKAWTDPETPTGQTPYIWLFSKEGGEGRRKSPENTFTETDMYTIPMPDGSRNLYLEDGLSQLEKGIDKLRGEFIELRRPIPLARRVKLMAFTSALGARTPRFRAHHRAQWEKILRGGEKIMRRMAEKTPEECRARALPVLPGHGPTLTLEQVREIAERPIHHLMPEIMKTEVPVFMSMQHTVLCAPEGSEFITSDAPLTRFDPEARKRPLLWQGVGLGYPTVEVVLPLGPQKALLLHHNPAAGRGVKPLVYRDVSAEVVDELNRRTRAYADEHVVVARNFFKPDWLRMGLMVESKIGAPELTDLCFRKDGG